jgi:hypothetical protein
MEISDTELQAFIAWTYERHWAWIQEPEPEQEPEEPEQELPPLFLGRCMEWWVAMAVRMNQMSRDGEFNSLLGEYGKTTCLHRLGIADAVSAWAKAEYAEEKRRTVARRKATRQRRIAETSISAHPVVSAARH